MRFAFAQLDNGPRLHYAEQGHDDGVPVVLLHGWPDSWFSFSRVLPLLEPSWRAFVLDQRGFGDSERPEGAYTIDQFAADVVAFMDAVSVERASIVGHSFGSFVTRRVALRYPDRVNRIVLIGAGALGSNSVTRSVQAEMATLSDPVPIGFAREFQSSTAHVPLPQSFFDRIVTESLKLPARLWRQVFDGILAYDDVSQLERLSAPTLLLWGEHDALFPREDQDRLVTLIPNATLTVYGETGHCPNWERPELVARDVQAFLREETPMN